MVALYLASVIEHVTLMAMIHFCDIANVTTWKAKSTSQKIWINNQSDTFIFFGDNLEGDPLFNRLTNYLHCQINPKPVGQVKFALNFTNDKSRYFQVAQTKYIDQLLYCPSMPALQQNGSFKKSLWQYFQSLGMIKAS